MPLGSFRLNTIGKNAAGTESYWFNIMSASSGDDRSLRSVVDSTGNVYVVGQYTANERGLIYKFNSNGTIQWQKEMAANYVLRDIAVDSTDGVYVCGGNESASPVKPWLAKINSADGTLTWQKTHTSDLAFTNQFNGIEIDTSGNINLCGRNNNSSGNYLGTMVRYTTAGVKGVSFSHAVTSANIEFFGICQSGSTITSFRSVGYYSSGSFNYAILCNRSTSSASTGYYFSRLSNTLASSTNNRFTRCVYDPSSQGYYAVGGTYEGAAKVVIIKMPSGTNNTITWARHLSVPTYATGVTIDSIGNIYVTYNNSNIGYIVKFNSSGTIQWTKSITTSSGYIILNGIKWLNNSLYITGETTVNGVIDSTLWKVPDDGTKTGTYGSFTYATDSNPTVTSYSPTLTAITQTLASRTNITSDTAITGASTTMTSTTTAL